MDPLQRQGRIKLLSESTYPQYLHSFSSIFFITIIDEFNLLVVILRFSEVKFICLFFNISLLFRINSLFCFYYFLGVLYI